MQVTEYSRKLDKTGRLMIPVNLRSEMGMVPGEVYTFSTHCEKGRRYICIDCGPVDEKLSLEKAMQIIQENGLKVVEDTY